MGPLYRFGPLGPPALPGLPMASYAIGHAGGTHRRTDRQTDGRIAASLNAPPPTAGGG